MSGTDPSGVHTGDEFVEAMGEALASWRLPRATGRVYGYLLLRADPSTSDEIRKALGLSAGAVSGATRELELWGLARSIPQRGSRRLHFEAAGGFEQLLSASHARARRFVDTLEAGRALTTGVAADRIDDVADLFSAYVDAGQAMLDARRPR